MRERRAQILLLVRAFEEVDRNGQVLPIYMRTAATRRALMVTGLSDWPGELTQAANFRNGETVLRRARLLFDGLRRKTPVLRGVLRVARLGAGTAPAVIGLALIVGMASNVLGPARHINLLSFPILGLLGWNLIVYIMTLSLGLAALIRKVTGSGKTAAESPFSGLATHLSGLFLKGALWRRLRGRQFASGGSIIEQRITAKAMVRFGALWHRHAGPLLAARVRRTLHVASVAMILGTVAGMYVRGLTFEYRAMWESTWLEPEQVQALLTLILGPAAAVLGVQLPEIASLQGPESEGGAAVWIHLYAVTALLFVVLPRFGLALLEQWRCMKLSAGVPIDLGDSYFRRLFTAWRGATRQVDILPYSFGPSTVQLDRLRALLQDSFGARAHIQFREPLGYGDDVTAIDAEPEDDLPGGSPGRESYLVVLFNLAQSPEAEVHGALLESVKALTTENGGRLLVLVDDSAYRRRVPDTDRIEQRRRAWARIAEELDLAVVDVELDQPIRERELVNSLMTAMREAVWPSREASGAA